MASGRITSVSLTHAYLRRIEELDVGGPALNAVRCVNPAALEEAAAADARRAGGDAGGPLLGIPVLVKDNVDVLGMPTTACSVVLADSTPRRTPRW